MFPRAIRVMRIGGIDVRIDPTWLLIAALVVLSFLSRWSGRFGTRAAVAMALAATVLFFASLLVHELGHAFEARYRGIEVSGITLFVLGGVTEMHGESRSPRDEFVVAAVGPFLSLVLGALFGILATTFDYYVVAPSIEEVFGLLGWVNVGLAVFNLIPGAPLDGGRVLRAGLWALLGNRRTAAAWAARAGQGFALATWGLAGWLVLAPNGSTFDALWLVFVGLFLWRGAQAERRHAALTALLEGHHAGALELDLADPVDAGLTVAMLANQLGGDFGEGARPVDRDGQVVGALVMDDVRRMHPQDQTFRMTSEVMRPASDLPHVPSDTPLLDVLRLFQAHPLALLDLDDGRTTTLTSRQLGVAMERLRLRRRGRPGPPAPSGTEPS